MARESRNIIKLRLFIERLVVRSEARAERKRILVGSTEMQTEYHCIDQFAVARNSFDVRIRPTTGPVSPAGR